jgi:cell wall-associated NlpC family hydrolase
MIGAPILDQARTLLGVPWRHMGRSTAGLDCIGLVWLAARQAGVALPEPPPYAREPQDHALRAALHLHLLPVALDATRPGDVLLFNLGLYAGHLGLAGQHPAYGVPSVVHAHLPRRAVVEEPRAPFAPRLTGAFRWRS